MCNHKIADILQTGKYNLLTFLQTGKYKSQTFLQTGKYNKVIIVILESWNNPTNLAFLLKFYEQNIVQR